MTPKRSITDPEVVAGLLRRRAAEESFWLDVSGPSMAPRIVSGGRVLVRAARRPHIGEIWAYCDREGRVVVHRCIGPARAGGWLFLGDAEQRTDPPVRTGVLIGKVRFIEHEGTRRRIAAPDRVRGAARALRKRSRSLIRTVAARSLKSL